MSNYIAKNNLIRLRLSTSEDIGYVMEAENSEDNRTFVGQWTHLQHLTALKHPFYAHLIVEDITTETPVGYVILAELTDPNSNLNLKRIVITEKGRGYGRSTLKLVKKLAFEKWNAHRLWLDVKTFNTRARNLYQSEGFILEGVARESVKAGDIYESLAIMSILQTEFEDEDESQILDNQE